jgi:DNA-directed RNA polymerase subunit M/transcription elongation factor TFIIS
LSRSHGDRKDTADRIYVLKKRLLEAERENMRLRKELNKALNSLTHFEKDEKPAPVKRKAKITCVKCKSDAITTSSTTLRDNTSRIFHLCDECGHREVIKK